MSTPAPAPATARPGFHTSEFVVAVLNLIGQIVAAAQGYVSAGTATKYSAAGGVAYILSRGLAKVVARSGGAG